jgi:hypothetical protein
MGKFNHLMNTLTLSLTCGLKQTQHVEYLIEMEVNDGFRLMTSSSDTKLNYYLSQKLKLIGRDEFNYLIYILTLPLKCERKLAFNRV